MKNKKNTEEQMKVHLRSGFPTHIKLRKRCEGRNRTKYVTVADYLAAAVEEFESKENVKLSININDLSDEKREALAILMSPDK